MESYLVHHGRRALIPCLPITLLMEPPKQVGILMFQSKPEVIIWENTRVFLPLNESLKDNQYIETSFGLADQEGQTTIARLEVATGQFVATVKIPSSLPGVIRWGERIFKRVGDVYREAFWAIAQELASEEQVRDCYQRSDET